MKDSKELIIVLTNYLALIDSIIIQTHLKDRGSIIKLKNDKKFIIKYIQVLEKEGL